MKKSKYILRTKWDSLVFGIDTYEIKFVSEDILNSLAKLKGHFTIRVDPLSSHKKVLYSCGFYYCDTLIEPYCSKKKIRYFSHPNVKIKILRRVPVKELIKISHGAFSYGRFHKDFNMKRKLSDLRYDRWLKKLYEANHVFALMFNNKCVCFFGYKGNKILLHAISKKYRGKGLAKYLWSVACRELFKKGHKELVSSISASNLAAVNLYSSLGFKFRNPVEIYHKLVV
jgi:GNAT superfamily N-acetyltransferase